MNILLNFLQAMQTGLCCSNYLSLETASYFVLYFEAVNLSAIFSYLGAIVAIKCCTREQLGVLAGCTIESVFCFVLFVGLNKRNIVYLKVAVASFFFRVTACLLVIVVAGLGLWLNNRTQQPVASFWLLPNLSSLQLALLGCYAILLVLCLTTLNKCYIHFRHLQPLPLTYYATTQPIYFNYCQYHYCHSKKVVDCKPPRCCQHLSTSNSQNFSFILHSLTNEQLQKKVVEERAVSKSRSNSVYSNYKT